MKYSYPDIEISRSLLTLVLCLSFFTLSFAQTATERQAEEPAIAAEWDANSPYYKIMAENVIKLDTFITYEDLGQLIATLERIARVEKDKALPQYYLAFALSSIAFKEKDLDNIDKWCDQSEIAIARAVKIGGIAEEEILVLRALVQYGRIQVDYMGRGLDASAKAERFLSQGYKINPENPRVLSVLGQHYLRIPAQAGGSLKKCCHFNSLAVAAYSKEQERFSKEEVAPIVPYWGRHDASELSGQYCTPKTTAKVKTKTP